MDRTPLHARMPLWKAAVLAFLAMYACDLLATAMVVYESRLNGPISGSLDVTGYIASLICSVLALDSILKDGWRNKRSLVIIASVSLSNFCGTWSGVAVSAALTGHH